MEKEKKTKLTAKLSFYEYFKETTGITDTAVLIGLSAVIGVIFSTFIHSGHIVLGFFSTLVISLAVYLLYVISFPLEEFFYVEVPIFLNARKLPLTKEEMENLSFTEKEFFEFIKYCTSKNCRDSFNLTKKKICTIYIFPYLMDAIIEMIHNYTELNHIDISAIKDVSLDTMNYKYLKNKELCYLFSLAEKYEDRGYKWAFINTCQFLFKRTDIYYK